MFFLLDLQQGDTLSKVTIKEQLIDKISAEEQTTQIHASSTVPPKNMLCQVVFKIKLVMKITTFVFVLNRTLRVF